MRDDERVNSAGSDISELIVNAVADAADVGPTELTPPLYEVVAPDALETLFAADGSRQPPTRLAFEYGDYAVEVTGHADGPSVDVEPLPGTAAAAGDDA